MANFDCGLPTTSPAAPRKKLVRKSVRHAREQAQRNKTTDGQQDCGGGKRSTNSAQEMQQLLPTPSGQGEQSKESNGNQLSADVRTARAVRISRNLDAVKTVHFGPGIKNAPQGQELQTYSQSPPNIPGNQGKVRFQAEIGRSFSIPRRPVGTAKPDGSQRHRRKPTPYPCPGSEITLPIYSTLRTPERTPDAGQGSFHQTGLSSDKRDTRPTPLNPGHPGTIMVPPRSSSRQTDTMEPPELELQSLYGTRVLVRVSSSGFQDKAYTPTPRLDHWLDDVEDSTEIRRAQIAMENAAVSDMLKRQRDSTAVAELFVRNAPSAQANGKRSRGEVSLAF
jgi:hypothetical protein